MTAHILTEVQISGMWEDAFLQEPLRSLRISFQSQFPESLSLLISLGNLRSVNHHLSEELMLHPEQYLKIGSQILFSMFPPDIQEMYKDILHIRPIIRIIENDNLISLKDIRCAHVGKFYSITGRIRKSQEVRSKIRKAAWKCLRCNQVQYQEIHGLELQEPLACDQDAGGCGCARGKTRFELLLDMCEYRNLQLIYLEELINISEGQPQTKLVFLWDDLVGVYPCNRATITGTIRLINLRKKDTNTAVLTPYIEANYVKIEDYKDPVNITSEDEEHILEIAHSEDPFDIIRRSIAPSIFGMEDVKSAIILQQAGGCMKIMPDQTKKRGNIHVLIIGDPGIAKSTILKVVPTISPVAFYGSGEGTTGGGLTFIVNRDELDGSWCVEMGLLPMCDGGICCIQENQRVITTHGSKEIKDIQIGDIVPNRHNTLTGCSVTAKIFKGIRETLKLHLYDGNIIECTPDHRLLTWDGWTEAANICVGDYIKIPAHLGELKVTDQKKYEWGFIHGFGLSDIYIENKRRENSLSFATSIKNIDRSVYVANLIKSRYDCEMHHYNLPKSDHMINGRIAKFSPRREYRISSAQLKAELFRLFHEDYLWDDSPSYKLGVLSGIMSTDCNISHRKGKFGVKHVIEIRLGREVYDEEWLHQKMRMISSMLQSLGIMSVCRRRVIVISSLQSYNRCVDLFGELLHGAKAEQLYHVEPRTKITSYDAILDRDYFNWFSHLKFKTSFTVDNGLHSRIYYAINHRKVVTVTLMETLRPHWANICDEPFREPNKNYLLNKVIKIEYNPTPQNVYDLTIDGEHSFTLEGGVVHNCFDELDKTGEADRERLHTVLESGELPVAKAGIVTTLSADTSLLAGANPKLGRFNPFKDLPSQIDLSPPLISRFDLIFSIRDYPDEDNDKKIAGHIIAGHQGDMEAMTPPLSAEFLRKYFYYVKNLKPTIPVDIAGYMVTSYSILRQTIPGLTPRAFEAIIRMSEASAKIRASPQVENKDVELAMRLFQNFLESVSTDPVTGKVDACIVTEGLSTSQRDRIFTMIEVLRNNEGTEGLDAVEWKRLCVEKGYPEKLDFNTDCERLKRDARIFERYEGRWKTC